ncbi:response regulator transcription factor [Frankia sp. AgB1.9]|nr:response regulator transcription factor [Frankia sp. AgW1.1]MBL7546501.1 response regulator transcription factor [Frankia sp. AgB1.9]MBL7620240.1 response regulator transcription factor [Frankia sp. AgB1.8]
MARVLIVDDDPTVADVLSRYLQRAGYDVDLAVDGPGALAAAATTPPDLVVLDLMLPGINGLEVCRRLRETGPVPVVMLTALGAEHDRIVGLEYGADDYVTKPFSPRELTLRVQSVLRRAAGPLTPVAGGVIDVGPFVVDLPAREVRGAQGAIALTVREFDLLAYLVRHPRRAFSRPELMETVWGWSYGDQSTVTVHIRRLREKLEADPSSPSILVTVWGVGYRYEPPGPAAA